MNIAQKLTIDDPLKFFRRLQRVIATVCIFIPLIFKLCDKDAFYPEKIKLCDPNIVLDTGFVKLDTSMIIENKLSAQISIKNYKASIFVDTLKVVHRDRLGFRNSVSDYANSSNSYLFGLLYCLAGLLFIFNGAVYINKPASLAINEKGRWLNIIIGLCLIGIVLVHNEVLHKIFSFLFFGLNVYVMAFLSNANETMKTKIIRIIMAALVLLSIGLFACNYISLLWAEWISLFFISLYLIMVSLTTKTG